MTASLPEVFAKGDALKPLVLFVCKHNTGRSQMAEAFLRRFVGDDVEVASAGTIAADRPDPGVVAAMADIGMDISSARPKLLDPALVARADRIITMGCDVEGVPRVDADWGLPDPKGQSPEHVRGIRDLVRKKAGDLAKELLRPCTPKAISCAYTFRVVAAKEQRNTAATVRTSTPEQINEEPVVEVLKAASRTT